MHFVALHKVFVFFICLSSAEKLDAFIQIPAQVFIHDREKEEELLVNTLLLNNKHTQFRKQRAI